MTFPVAGPDRALGEQRPRLHGGQRRRRRSCPPTRSPPPTPPRCRGARAPRSTPRRRRRTAAPPIPCTWDSASPYSWQTNRRQEAVQAYYLLNVYHDHLAAPPIGFTEAAGNFQVRTTAAASGAAATRSTTATLVGANLGRDGRPQAPQQRLDVHTARRHARQHVALPVPPRPHAPRGPDGRRRRRRHRGLPRVHARTVGPPRDDARRERGALRRAVGGHERGLERLVRARRPGRAGLPGGHAGGRPSRGRVDQRRARACARSSPTASRPAAAAGCAATPAGTAGPGGFTYGDFGEIAGEPEVHADGEIWLQTLWQLRTALGSARDGGARDARDGALAAGTHVPRGARRHPRGRRRRVYGGAHHDAIWRTCSPHGGWASSPPTRDTFDAPPGRGLLAARDVPRRRLRDAFRARSSTPPPVSPCVGALVHLAGGRARRARRSERRDATPNGRSDLGRARRHLPQRGGLEAPATRSCTFGPVTVRRRHAPARSRSAGTGPRSSGGARIAGVTGPDRTTDAGELRAARASSTARWPPAGSPRSRGHAVLTIRLPAVGERHRRSGWIRLLSAPAPNSDTRAFRIWTRTAHGRWTLAFATVAGLPSGRTHHRAARRPARTTCGSFGSSCCRPRARPVRWSSRS